MTDPTLLVPNSWRLTVARDFIASVSSTYNNTALYLYYGSHVPIANAGTIAANDDVQGTVISVYRNMIAGKRILPHQCSLVIPNYPWVSGTVYAMYDDADPFLLGKEYYAIVNASSFYHVWKCLDNDHSAQSTIQPVFSDVDSTDDPIRYSDGYLWKYMYSVPSATVTRFGTVEWFPVVANTEVTNTAANGAINVIEVSTQGSGYNNWLVGTLTTAGIQVNGNNRLYSITGNNIHLTNGYYTGCKLYISAGTGSGQFANIADYFTNGNGNFVVISQKFPITPHNGSEFQINPGISIVGDSQQSVNAHGMGLVNAAGNTIYRVQMLEVGAGYAYTNAQVVANAVVGVTNTAVIRAIYSPPGGHGFDQAAELGANAISITATIANTEANTIPATNDFQQIGILADPLFSNTQVWFANNTGVFQATETVSAIQTRLLANGLSISNDSPALTGGFIGDQVVDGEWLYLVAGDGTRAQLSMVNAITNSSSLNIASNGLFISTDTTCYLANLTTNATMVSIATGNSILITSVAGSLQAGDLLVGQVSGAEGNVAQIFRSNTQKGFGTYIQLTQFYGIRQQGTFAENEQIYQGLSLATSASNAWVHSVQNLAGNSVLVLASNVVGPWDSVAGAMTGANSLAIANVSTFYGGELVFGSGRVILMENIDSTTRTSTNSENYNFILTF